MTRKIAIVGMSFRFPGTTTEDYWSDLMSGKDMVTAVDPSRWALETFRHPRKSHPGTSYTFAAGTLGDISGFDAAFFGISPREAQQMDPQQRLLLELTWEAFENGGIPPSSVKGSNCGVYVGISSADYAYRFADDLGAIDSTVATGNTTSIAANRISYVFDLHGPSMAIDTACSSSMVAFHQACQSIRNGECGVALAGGVSLHLHPYGFIAFSKASMLSRQGQCRAFDASGDGYVRSEGGGIFVLKDYEQAISDGNRVLALVVATGINSDGRKSGLTVPSSEAQAALLQDVYARAGIEPNEIDYIEAHGTGTAVGDPIETHALGEAIGKRRPLDRPLPIGSVKSNMGHLEAASGVAGLVKAVHCLQQRALPATIHFSTPNPNIPFDQWNLQPVAMPVSLRKAGRVVIGVNSFGFGGANAHAALESVPVEVTVLDAKPHRHREERAVPLIISAKSPEALKDLARNYAAILGERGNHYDTAYAAAFTRDRHEYRALVFTNGDKLAAEALGRFALGKAENNEVETGEAMPAGTKVAFIYSGNGAQWATMGRQLLETSPVFHDVVRRIDAIFKPLGGFSIIDEFNGLNGERYSHTDIAQPALFAYQAGITEMLRRQGIRASVVAGHSVGEVAAAWAAGALSLEQAVSVIFHRSRLQETTRGMGEMLAAAINQDEYGQLLAHLPAAQLTSLAAVNSPKGITIAGEATALNEVELQLAQHGKSFKRLDLPYAFHSTSMDTIESGIYKALAALKPSNGTTTYYSTVTGDQLAGSFLDAFYWWQNIRNPVRFGEVIDRISASGPHLFIEIGPHAVLRGYINECLKEHKRSGRVIATSLRGSESAARIGSVVAQALISGAEPDWSRIFPVKGKQVRLPTYPWQRASLWHRSTSESLNLLGRQARHPLLGYPVAGQELAWESLCDTHVQPVMADHVVGDAVVFPGAGYVELALAAAVNWQQLSPTSIVEVEDLEIQAPLLMDAEHTKQLRVRIDATDGSISVASRAQFSEESWQENAVARLPRSPFDLLRDITQPVPPQREWDFDAALHAQLTAKVGLHYGPAFQSLLGGWVDRDLHRVIGKLRPAEAISQTLPDYCLHPALLDCGFQLLVHLAGFDDTISPDFAYVPTRIGRLQFRAGAAPPVHIVMQVTGNSPHSVNTDFRLFNGNGECVAFLAGVRFRRVRLLRAAAEHLRHLAYVGVPMPLPAAIAQQQTHGAPTSSIFSQLAAGINSLAAEVATDVAEQRYVNEIEPLLDVLCASFAQDATRPRSLASHDSLDAAAQYMPSEIGGIAPTTRDRILNWLRAGGHLVDPGQVAPNLDGDTPCADHLDDVAEEFPPAVDIYNTILAEHPDYFDALHAVALSGSRLARQLRGNATPDQGDFDQVLSSLRRQALSTTCRRKLVSITQSALSALLRETVEGQRLKVIEISQANGFVAADAMSFLDADRCELSLVTAEGRPAPDAAQDDSAYQPATRHISLQEAQAATAGVRGQCSLAIVCNDFSDEATARAAYTCGMDNLRDGGFMLWMDFANARWLQFVQICGARAAESWDGRQPELQSANTAQAAGWLHDSIADGSLAETTSFALGANTPACTQIHLARAGQSRRDVTTAPLPATSRVWVLLEDGAIQPTPVSHAVAKQLGALGHSVRQCNSLAAGIDAFHALLAAKEATQEFGGFVLLPVRPLDDSEAAPAHRYADASLAGIVNRCSGLCEMLRRLEQPVGSVPCWVVTTGATIPLLPKREGRAPTLAGALGGALHGFTRALMNEPGAVKWRLLDLESLEDGEAAAAAIAGDLLAADIETEVFYTRAGARFIPRLRYVDTPAGSTDAIAHARRAAEEPQHLSRLGFQFPGQLRNLRWESHVRRAPAGDEIEIRVQATGLNFRDIMYSLGLLSDEAVEGGFAGATLGLECAGIVERVGPGVSEFAEGDRVLAFGPASFADYMITKCIAVAHMPRDVSYEAAATIPSAFFTAYYALHHVARLAPGERILIHGAAGGVGVAAIQLAHYLGAEVFATAGSEDKRDFVRLLGSSHVFDSRTLSFADEILMATGGEGIDVVLNSLAGEAINRNLRVLRPFGRFLELGKRDFYENAKIGLRPFRNNISFYGIDADQLMRRQPALTKKLFQEMIALFTSGALHPLPYRAFEAGNIVDAFRHMQQARHIGKIVVTGYERLASAPAQSRPPLRFPADMTWLVTGGLGGFGLRSAQWLAGKGVRNLVLIGRRGPSTSEAVHAIAQLESAGVRVKAQACDVSDALALSRLLEEVQVEMPPLRGILHAAAVISDALGRNISTSQISDTFAPKVAGALNLHHLTQNLPIEYFILYSSATTLFGNPGQASYVAANAAIEGLAAVRRAAGQPATCIAWGPIDDVGFLARNAGLKSQLVSRMGSAGIHSDVALTVLDQILRDDRANVGVMTLDWRAMSRFLPSAGEPKFTDIGVHFIDGGDDASSAEDIERMLAEMSDAELSHAFIGILRTEIGEILRLAPDKIDPTRSIYDMGLDSLMGVELMVAVESRFGIRLPVMALSETPTVAKLADKVIAQLRDARSAESPIADGFAQQVQQAVLQHAPDVAREAVEQFVADAGRTGPAQPGRMIH